MAQSTEDVLNSLDDLDRSGFLDELADFYQGRGYEILAQERRFPRESEDAMGKVDLFLENPFSDRYLVVEATKAGTVHSSNLERYVSESEQKAEKARDYFRTNIDSGRIDTEVVLGTEGDLTTVRELWRNTDGVFTWDQALDAVSDTDSLQSIRDRGYILPDYDISRKENEEYFELSPELEGAVDILREYRTYP